MLRQRFVLPSEEELFPTKTNTELDKQLNELFRPYNTIVEYRYIKNLIPDDWYYIYPVEEELVVPMAEFLKAYWIGPLEAGSSREFVVNNFPRMILLIGSSAYNHGRHAGHRTGRGRNSHPLHGGK